MESLERKTTRRNFIKVAGVAAGSAIIAGCRTFLPTNVLENFGKKTINIDEDSFKIAGVELFGQIYSFVPINEDKRKILRGGEPSFALIPETKEKVKVRGVGVKGKGKVIISAPEGDLYLPYALTKEQKLVYPSNSDIVPIKLKTEFNVRKREDPAGINLITRTEKDFLYADELLEVIVNEVSYPYAINKMTDLSSYSEKDNLFPGYWTFIGEEGIDVDFDKTKGDGKIRIIGVTYLFKKGETLESYINNRGFKLIPTSEIKEEKQEKKLEPKESGASFEGD